jgi:hypothetical protein
MNKKDETIIKRAIKRRERAHEADHHNREQMVDDLRFANLDQWPEDVKRERKNRPMLTLDHTNNHVKQVTGDMQENQPSIKVFPADSGADKDTANVIEGLVREIEYNSSAQHVYLNAARSQVKCGFGVWRVLNEFPSHDVFDQEIRLKPVKNPLNWWFDPDAKEPTKCDGRFVIGSERLLREDYEESYGGVPTDFHQRYTGETLNHWTTDEYVTVAEYYEKVKIKREMALLSNGDVLEVDQITEQDRQFFSLKGIEIVKVREADSYEIHYYKLTDFKILKHVKLPYRYFPIVPVFGEVENIEGKEYIRGLIRPAKDPQRMYNYARSAEAETIALQPKAPYLATTKQIAKHKRLWNRANIDNLPYLLYTPDDNAPPPQRQAPPTVQSGLMQQSLSAAEDIKSATGIFNAGLGDKGPEISGKAIIAKQQESDTSTSVYMFNLALAIEHTGRIIIDMIPYIYDTAQMKRIRGEDGTEEEVEINQPYLTPDGVRIKNDLTRGKYDVRVSVGPSYKTKRIEAANTLVELSRVMPQLTQIAGDLVAKNLDVPGAEELESRLKKMLPAGIIDDPEMQEQQEAQQQQAMQQAEILLKEKIAEIQSKEAKTQKDLADTKKTEMETISLANEIDSAQQLKALQQLVALLQSAPGNAGNVSSPLS